MKQFGMEEPTGSSRQAIDWKALTPTEADEKLRQIDDKIQDDFGPTLGDLLHAAGHPGSQGPEKSVPNPNTLPQGIRDPEEFAIQISNFFQPLIKSGPYGGWTRMNVEGELHNRPALGGSPLMTAHIRMQMQRLADDIFDARKKLGDPRVG